VCWVMGMALVAPEALAVNLDALCLVRGSGVWADVRGKGNKQCSLSSGWAADVLGGYLNQAAVCAASILQVCASVHHVLLCTPDGMCTA
jgi:hypothetical protein